jgi:hypothetical protein
MKFKYSIISLSVAAMLTGGFTSCKDSFLDVESKTSSTTGNFYKTEADAWRALVGCYDGWRQISSNPGISFYVASTVMSDETYGATGNGDGRGYQVIDRFDQSQSPSDLNLYEEDWSRYYEGVYRINELVAHDENINWTTEGKRELYLGEARALRALLYFDMVRLWGNIPLFLEPVNENREQADPDEVYKAIFDDLQYAIDNIPAKNHDSLYGEGGAGDGHITKYAAEAVKARAYLFYKGYYGKEPSGVTASAVLADLQDIIANGGYKLVDSFKSLWPAASLVPLADSYGWDTEKSTYAGEANSEVILQMKFTPSQDYNGNGDSNRWLVMMGMRSPMNFAPYGKGWGACTVCTSYISKFENGDSRATASYIDVNGEGISSTANFTNGYKDQREYTGYYVKKYAPLCFYDGTPATKEDGTGDFQISNANNWVIVRYADVLLMAAELGDPNAQSYLDQVRARAGLASVPVTQENIMKERATEFAFEGIRYWDLLRQGIDVAANAIAASSGNVKSGGNDDVVTITAANVRATKGLCQIPNNQITLSNGVLKQNAGWE